MSILAVEIDKPMVHGVDFNRKLRSVWKLYQFVAHGLLCDVCFAVSIGQTELETWRNISTIYKPISVIDFDYINRHWETQPFHTSFKTRYVIWWECVACLRISLCLLFLFSSIKMFSCILPSHQVLHLFTLRDAAWHVPIHRVTIRGIAECRCRKFTHESTARDVILRHRCQADLGLRVASRVRLADQRCRSEYQHYPDLPRYCRRRWRWQPVHVVETERCACGDRSLHWHFTSTLPVSDTIHMSPSLKLRFIPDSKPK